MFEMLSAAEVVAAALTAPPGLVVIAALQRVDPASLDDHDRVDMLVAWERQMCWLASCTQPTMAAVGNATEAAAEKCRTRQDSDDMPIRAAHAEIASCLRLSEYWACSRLEVARALTGPLSAVQQALAEGDITTEHARAIVEAVAPLPVDKQIWVADRVLPRARRQTVAQLRACLIRAVLLAEPASAAQRNKKAHSKRRLDWYPLPDGMAELHLTASAKDILTVYATADTLAKQRRAQLPKFGNPGWQPIDALRADALVDLVTGNTGGSTGGRMVRSTVTTLITMDLPTALGLQNNPGELAGYGPIPAPLARILATDSTWRRLICDPLTGALIDLGHTSHDPSAELTRYIQTRDTTCAMPSCNRPAADCEIDHTIPYKPTDPGGRTDRNNLGALCKGHHRVKHETGWKLTRDPDTEKATWTSLSGHQYPVEHHDHRSTQTTGPPDNPDPHDYDPDLPDPPEPIRKRGLIDFNNRLTCTRNQPHHRELIIDCEPHLEPECPF